MSEEISKLLLTLLGGLLAILGGLLANIFRLRLEKKQEINYIKISVNDELRDICDHIKEMQSSWEKFKIIHVDYLNDIKGTDAYDRHKNRFFIINDKDLRASIKDFYRDLHKKIKIAESTIGTLGGASGTESEVVSNFKTISDSATNLIVQMDKHKYKVFWVA